MQKLLSLAFFGTLAVCGVSKASDAALKDNGGTETGLYKRVVIEGINDASYSATVTLAIEPCHDKLKKTYHVNGEDELLVIVEKITSETADVCAAKVVTETVSFADHGVSTAILFVPADATVKRIQ